MLQSDLSDAAEVLRGPIQASIKEPARLVTEPHVGMTDDGSANSYASMKRA